MVNCLNYYKQTWCSMVAFSNTFVISSFIHWLPDWCFSSKFSRHLESQTVWARDLKFCENVHFPPFVTCHMSCVTCHVCLVTCRAHIYFSFFRKIGEPSQWWICYQWDLPCLVIKSFWYFAKKKAFLSDYPRGIISQSGYQ